MVDQLIKKGPNIAEPFAYPVERETRFELATSTLARLHSTTELFPLNLFCVKTAVFIQSLIFSVNKKTIRLEFFIIIISSPIVTKNREGFYVLRYNDLQNRESKDMVSFVLMIFSAKNIQQGCRAGIFTVVSGRKQCYWFLWFNIGTTDRDYRIAVSFW